MAEQKKPFIVLARKYRPQTLEDVMGQDHVTTTLRNAISGDRVAHAYLFTGARGVGKTSSARILAKALNCKNGPTITPCSGKADDPNSCENCKEITAGNSLDVMEIDAASNTGVDNVRELQEGLRYMPGKSRYKIYIIDEVHMLSGSAFNALLKTLEEPPAHVRFIFATTEPHKIPVTILSRCQRFDFKRISRAKIVQQLSGILAKEEVTFTDGALQILAHEAEGSMRDALSLTDQALAFGSGKLDEATVTLALGVIDRKVLGEGVRAILGGDAQALLELVDQVYDYGYDVRQFTKNLLEHFRNLLVVRVSRDATRLVDLPIEDVEELKRQAADVPIERLHRLFSALLKLGEDVSRSSHPRMALEIGLVRVASLGPLQPVEELLGRLKDLSSRPPPIAGGLAGAEAFRAPTPPRSIPQPRAPEVRPPAPVESAVRDLSPVPPIASAPEKVAPVQPVTTPAKTDGENLLAHIQRTNTKLGDQIRACKFTIEPNQVLLTLPVEQGFLLPKLKMNLAEELARGVAEFLGKRVPVDIRIQGGGMPDIAPPPPSRQQQGGRRSGGLETPADKARKTEAVNHPAVQQVMRIFDSGKIMDVHLLSDTTLVTTESDPQEQES